MLTAIRADNFRCLDGFELKLDGHALLLGLNGSGKSTVIELLERLRSFWVAGNRASDCFPPSTRSRWQPDRPQVFELEFERKDYSLRLRVVLAQPDGNGIVRIAEEQLIGNDLHAERVAQKPLVLSTSDSNEPNILVPDELSALPLLLSTFPTRSGPLGGAAGARYVASMVVPFRIEPASMETIATTPSSVLRFDGGNFAAWLLGQSKFFRVQLDSIEDRIAEVLPDFVRFTFEAEGDRFRLYTEWAGGEHRAAGGPTTRYDFRELSDGQRVICLLASLVEVAQREERTWVLDEPDNYLALQEIQPLLLTLLDTERIQLVVASHHPEILNSMARTHGYVFSRQAGGPAVVKRWAAPAETTLTVAELVARGEIHGGA